MHSVGSNAAEIRRGLFDHHHPVPSFSLSWARLPTTHPSCSNTRRRGLLPTTASLSPTTHSPPERETDTTTPPYLNGRRRGLGAHNHLSRSRAIRRGSFAHHHPSNTTLLKYHRTRIPAHLDVFNIVATSTPPTTNHCCHHHHHTVAITISKRRWERSGISVVNDQVGFLR
jgi:hypothetical protein